MLMKGVALNCLSVVPNDFQDNVNDSNVGVNGSILSFPFFMSNDASECSKMLLNVD